MQSLKDIKTIIKSSRKKKKHDKIVFLAKRKLNTIKVLISKALMQPYVNHDKTVLVNSVFR